MGRSAVLEKHENYLMKFLKKYFINDKTVLDSLKNHKVIFQNLFHDIGHKQNLKTGTQVQDALISLIPDKFLPRNKELSFISYLRLYVVKFKKIDYEEFIEFVNQMFGEYLFDPPEAEFSYDYFDAIKTFKRDYPIDKPNAQAEWRAFFEFRFLKSSNVFFNNFYEDITVSMNFSPWSFLFNTTLPPYRTHFNFDTGGEIELQEKAFGPITERATYNYSFVWDMVQNNVSSIFYFHRTLNDSIEVCVIDPDTVRGGKGGKGRGNPKFIGKCTLLKIGQNVDDIDYKKNVISFLIKSGIFLPFKAAINYDIYADIKYENLLDQSRPDYLEFEEICMQYKPGKSPTKSASPVSFEDRFCRDAQLDKVIDYLIEHHPEQIEKRIDTFNVGFLDLLQLKDNMINHIYWLPIPINWRNRASGGTAFLNTNNPIFSAKEKRNGIPKEYTNINENTTVSSLVIGTMYFLMGLIEVNQIEEIEQRIRLRTERAAAASIMSRNISHNLASHVLSYIKNILSSESLMLENGIFDGIFDKIESKEQDSTKNDWTINPKIYKNNKLNTGELFFPYLRSIGKLLGFFQERQDYVGIIASGWNHFPGSVNLKDSILFPFIDREGLPIGDENSLPKNLILDYIVFSEGYRGNDIEIKLFYKNGGKEYEIKDLDKDAEFNRIEVAVPSGITGRQAFYSILENFIRNSAKHGLPKSERKGMKVDIHIKDFDEDYYEFMIESNGGKLSEDDLERIQKVLNAGLVKEETGNVDEKHKGVKEMQIAAGWLRGLEPHELTDAEKLEGLKALEVRKSGEGNKNLCYTFYIRKAKQVLLILPSNDSDLLIKYKKLYEEEFNWYVKTVQDLDKLKLEAYYFVLIHKSVSSPHLIEKQTPVRVIKGLGDGELLSDFNLNTLSVVKENLLLIFYEKWLDLKLGGEFVFDTRNPDLLPSELGIGIYDVSAISEKREESELELITDFHFEKEKAYNNSIVFRKHNDIDSHFVQFFENIGDYKDIIYVEGISGGNSTNRLLRQEKITEFWCMKMREVALTKVLIIDERIWNKNKRQLDGVHVKHEKLKLKNISVLTGIVENEKFVFIDLKDERVASIDFDGNFKWEKENDEKNIRSGFHFVSLHQGLLDKITEHCKNYLKAKNIYDDKEKATTIMDMVRGRKRFAAKFRSLIHSGRSKTPILPEETSFIQISALEAALNDSKYTLNELLYSSIIETSNENG